MLAIWGLITILGMIVAIASRRVSPLVALFLFPVTACLAAGFGLRTAQFALSGLVSIAPVVAMFLFAILFFGVLTDAGTIEPFVKILLRGIGKNPVLIVPGTALLALLLHLDGSGAVVFLVAIPTLLPLYQELGMDRRILACAVSLAAGVNFLPWTGPTIRAASALHTTPIALFKPLIPVQIVGLVYVFAVAVYLGRKESRRIGHTNSKFIPTIATDPIAAPGSRVRLACNLILAVAVLSLVISGKVEPAIAFMLGTTLALLLNFRTVREQSTAIDRHAKAALSMCAILCSAGVFTGILKGSGMLAAMANASIAHIPAGFAPHIPFVLGLVAMPLSLLFDPDSFYFGILPVLAAAVQGFGLPAASVAEAALLGQMTTGFPVSPLTPATFLVTGLSEIELSAHQRFAGPFLLGASVVMTIAAVLFHVIPL
jgi:CitMHS family citrate-Mg2+:H+ or citrate-Ca2+:H+ symporter